MRIILSSSRLPMMIKETFYDMIEQDDEESSYRAKILLIKDKGYTVPEIRMMATNHHMMLT